MKFCHFCHFVEQPCHFSMLILGLASFQSMTDFLSHTVLAVQRINMVMKTEFVAIPLLLMSVQKKIMKLGVKTSFKKGYRLFSQCLGVPCCWYNFPWLLRLVNACSGNIFILYRVALQDVDNLSLVRCLSLNPLVILLKPVLRYYL